MIKTIQMTYGICITVEGESEDAIMEWANNTTPMDVWHQAAVNKVVLPETRTNYFVEIIGQNYAPDLKI